jgi:hypothetical protein
MRLPRFARNDISTFFGLFTKPSNFLDLRGKTVCVLEDFIGNPEILGDMAVVFENQGLSLPGKVVEFAFFDSLHDPSLNDFQIPG